ncbi:hypothetical protein PGB90_008830 [Kerria lacca]
MLILLRAFAKPKENLLGTRLNKIPGTVGSVLLAKLNNPHVPNVKCINNTANYFTLFLNTSLFNTECFEEYITLQYDKKTRLSHSPEGIDIIARDFNGSFFSPVFNKNFTGVSNFYEIANISKMLFKMGYVEKHSLIQASYDFRLGPRELKSYCIKLKHLIEQTYTKEGRKPVILFVISHGAMVTATFFTLPVTRMEKKYVKRLISISGSWAGSPGSWFTTVNGFPYAYAVIKSGYTFPSNFAELPYPAVFGYDRVFVTTDNKNYTLRNIKEYYNDAGYPTGYEIYKNMYPYINDYTDPGVEIHAFYSSGIPTVSKLIYTNGTFPHGAPNVIYGDGDGLVAEESLRGSARWSKYQYVKEGNYHGNISSFEPFIMEILEKD